LQFGFIRNNSKATSGTPRYANNIDIFDELFIVSDLKGLHIMNDGPEIYVTSNFINGTPPTITLSPGLTIDNKKEISIINDGTAYINGTLTVEKSILNGFRRLISPTNAYMLIDENGIVNTPVFVNGNSTGDIADITLLPLYDFDPNITNATLELEKSAQLTIADTLINGGGRTTNGTTPELNHIIMNGASQITIQGIFQNGLINSSLAKLTLNDYAIFTASGNVINADQNTDYSTNV
jgi:hypothetical protein